jgi:hypothetical protein
MDDAKTAIEQGVGLFLHGSIRDCNSTAIGILKEMMKKGHMCYYAPYDSCISSDNPSHHKVMNSRYTFVCIADITSVLDNLTNFRQTILTGTNTNFAVSYLQQILTSRASLNLPTFITSSVGLEMVTSKFPSLETTLYGNLLSIECVESDFRGRRAYEKLEHEFGFDQIQ